MLQCSHKLLLWTPQYAQSPPYTLATALLHILVLGMWVGLLLLSQNLHELLKDLHLMQILNVLQAEEGQSAEAEKNESVKNPAPPAPAKKRGVCVGPCFLVQSKPETSAVHGLDRMKVRLLINFCQAADQCMAIHEWAILCS